MNDCMVASRFVDTALRTEEQVMTLSIDRLAEAELGYWQFRVAQLEMIVGELLLKNEQLRMAQRPKQEKDVAEPARCGT
jgi:hypothetical protein